MSEKQPAAPKPKENPQPRPLDPPAIPPAPMPPANTLDLPAPDATCDGIDWYKNFPMPRSFPFS